jgi:hypothetical protein
VSEKVNSGRELSAEQVAQLFRDAARYGPFPSEFHCQQLAALINSLPFNRDSVPIRPRANSLEPTIRRLSRLVGDRLEWLRQARLSLEPSVPLHQRDILVIEERNFEQMRIAILGVMPHVGVSRPMRSNSYWHRTALVIAHHARAYWQAAGRPRIGTNPNSPLVRFVIKVLDARGYGPHDMPPETMASVLRRAK